MPVTIRIENYASINIRENAMLSADVEAGGNSLPVTNNNNVKALDYILVGRVGSETAELQSVASISGATMVTTGTLKFRHDQYEAVTVLLGNKLRVYRAPDVNGLQPLDAAFAVLDTIDIDTDQGSTEYTDPNGGSGFWYKFVYFNELTSSMTALSSSRAARGGSVGNYTSNDDIRDAAGFKNNRNITDAKIDLFRQSAQSYINGELSGIYIVPFTAPINPFIAELTKVYAAGLLQQDQYGIFTTNSTNNGSLKIEWVEQQILKIRSGSVVITGATGIPADSGSGNSGASGSGLGFKGFPNSATAVNGVNDFMFKRTDIDGYHGRKY